MESTVYYIHLNGQQMGPYKIHQLPGLGITADTMVWRSDMPDWVEARTLSELTGVIPQQEVTEVLQDYHRGPSASDNSLGDLNVYDHSNGANNPYDNQGQYGNSYGQPQSYGQQPYNSAAGAGQGMSPTGTSHSSNPYAPYGENPAVFGNGASSLTNWYGVAIVATVLSILTLELIGLVCGIIGIVKGNAAKAVMQNGKTEEALRYNNTSKIFTIISLCFVGLSIIATIFCFAFTGMGFYDVILELMFG